MSQPAPPPASPPVRRRGRLRRLFRWALLALLLAAFFHRPLVRFIAIRIAAFQHLALDFRISGTVFTNLTIEGIRVAPNGTGTTPVEKIEIEKMRFDYSLPMLARHGIGELLRSYELRHADIVIVVPPPKPGEPGKARRETIGIAQQLRMILAQPAAYSDRAEVEDFSIRVRLPNKDEVVVEGVDLLFAPDGPGHVRVKRIAIPKLPVWENLHAETSYEKRNLFIKNLQITPEVILKYVNFDASQRAEHKGSVSLGASVFGGDISFKSEGSRLNEKGKNIEYSYATATKLSAKNINVRAAAAYFGAPNLPVESLGMLEAEFTGEPEKPRTWKGRAAATVEGIAAGRLKIARVDLNSNMDAGVAKTTVDVAVAGNALKLTATAKLPATVNEFDTTDAEATVQLDAPNLAELGVQLALKEPLSGAASAEGRIALRDRTASADLTFAIEKLAAGETAIKTARVKLSVAKKLGQPGFAALNGGVNADIKNVRLKAFVVDSATVRGSMSERNVKLDALEISRGANTVSANGTWQIPLDFKDVAKAPVDAQFAINVPDLAAFGIVVKEQTLGGSIVGKGAVKLIDGAPVGGIEIDGAGFKLGGFIAENLTTRVKLANRAAEIEQLTLKLNANDQLAVTGSIGIDAPNAYSAKVLAGIKSLAVLQPLLEVLGIKESLAGSLDIDCSGKGALKPAAHEGAIKLGVAKARYGKIDLSEFRLAGSYGPGFAKSTDFRVTSGITSLGGILDFGEGKLRLRDIDLTQGQQQALSGYIIIPLDLANAAQRIPLEERIAINVNVSSLDLDKLLASFGKSAPVSGSISASLVSGGTMLNPAGQLQLKARALKAKAAPQFDGAEVDLTLHYADKKLDLDLTARQREIQPLTIVGRLPLDIEKTVKEKAYDPALPIDFTLKLPPSSLASVPKFVPAVRRIEGTAGLDLRVAGTFGKPDITLGIDVNLKEARMTAANVPAIGEFQAKIGYANEVLSLHTFKGGLGGGTFKLGGTVKVPELDQLSFGPVVSVPKTVAPVFDLRLESDDVLVLRDDSITVRADTDVKLAGPLNAAAATGTIYITQSRFFKEIDILPIGLPGRPKPAPKSAPSQKSISFPNPPLRDWKFDIAIKTRDDDPFGIRGNLANGTAALNLRFAGTGLKPWLDGNIRIEKFKANLPFSTLSITRGFIYFKQDAPFMPSLDIQAESQARDYLVGAYIYGSASDPQIQLSSEPPLPHSDIVSLLATGTTTAELGANAEVLASRAAMLAVKQLYQKMFKKGTPPPPSAAKTSDGNMLDRFQMQLGATDNRSGRQEIVTRFKINDQLYLIGDAGVDGQFTGRLKYLIRFR